MIELSSVAKVYQRRASDVVALGGVSLNVEEGQSVAIVGESGSGKTTLARILLGLVAPTAGSYTYRGNEVARLDNKTKRKWRTEVQAVFQNPLSALNPRLKVEVLVTEPLEAARQFRKGERRAKAVECLRLVGLPDEVVDRYPHQLSGGQRQRVAIARALSSDPRVLVLDEPVSALDVSVRSQILNLLKRLQRERQLTYVYVTHDLATVEFLCDTVYVLYRGLVFESGSVEEVLRHPKNPYTELLIESIPSIEKYLPDRLLTQTQEQRPVSNELEGCLFADRCPYVEAICKTTPPTLRSEGAKQHMSRCHFQLDLDVGSHKVEQPS